MLLLFWIEWRADATYAVAWKLCNFDDSVYRQMLLCFHSKMKLKIMKMASWAYLFTLIILALRQMMLG